MASDLQTFKEYGPRTFPRADSGGRVQSPDLTEDEVIQERASVHFETTSMCLKIRETHEKDWTTER